MGTRIYQTLSLSKLPYTIFTKSTREEVSHLSMLADERGLVPSRGGSGDAVGGESCLGDRSSQHRPGVEWGQRCLIGMKLRDSSGTYVFPAALPGTGEV